ncbi:hypothetical protein ACI2OX_07420 [Bacillus sp. N9]
MGYQEAESFDRNEEDNLEVEEMHGNDENDFEEMKVVHLEEVEGRETEQFHQNEDEKF